MNKDVELRLMVGYNDVSCISSAFFFSLDFNPPGRHNPCIGGCPETRIVMQKPQVRIQVECQKPDYHRANIKKGESYPHEN